MPSFLLETPYFEGMIGLGLLLTLALFYLAFGGNAARDRQKKLERIKGRKQASILKVPQEAAGSLRRKTGDTSLPLLNRLVDALPSLTQLRARLERAGKTISAERYIFISLLLFALVTLIVQLVLHKSVLLSIFLGIILGIGIPYFLLGYWGKKRLKAFVRLFPDALDLIVRGLRSGLPVSESIKLVSREVPDPVAGTFQSVADTMKLGVPLEKILSDTARRLQCTEFNFFVTSIILQRETGGNLSEILNNLSEVLRARFMMKEKIKAMTSEARASMIIIGCLPFVVMLAVSVMSPDYLQPLFTDYRGNIAAAGALTSLLTGIGVMTKMSKFEI